MAGVYNIPSGYSFLESLAKGLFRMGVKDPFHLCQMEIFLPTRRACIELKRALMRQGIGRCILLPKLSLLGDLDEDEEWLSSPQDELDLKPLIPPFKRLGLLTNLIEEYAEKSGIISSPTLSLKLAKTLLRLMDQAAIENVPWEGLVHLVPSEFASHWQLTLNFLEIITTHWPKIIEEKGFLEPYIRHHQMVDILLARWEKAPPQHPILAAGSTGTMPATARLLQTIARLPEGMVILPGLDTTLSAEETKGLPSCHPQYAPTRFLQKIDLYPSEVLPWPGLERQEEGNIARARLFAEALKPSFSLPSGLLRSKAPRNDGWEDRHCEAPKEPRQSSIFNPSKALEGVYLIPCASPQEEALAIAILLRQQLEVPHQRIALITSDLKLSERVTWELKRWGIEIDSSSGEALDQTPPGVFLNLCAEFAANPQDQVALLSLLKHPLFHMGKPPGVLRSDIRQFEKKSLRGDSFSRLLRPSGTRNACPRESGEPINVPRLKAGAKDCEAPKEPKQSSTLKIPLWLQEFHALMRPFINATETSFKKILNAHCEIAERLSTDEEGVCQLWKGAKGEAIRGFVENLKEASEDFPPLSLMDYPPLLKELFQGQSLRFRPQKHPRLAIFGPIEARLFHADVMILGGLNEGTWPPDIDVDPWLNRPMRHEMGFPSPERRIGLSSHDFGQAFTSPKVYLTRALKVEGTPTLACRWVERLEVYLKAWNLVLPEEPRILEWVRQFDQPETQEAQAPPLPTPPQKSRPRRLSVTQIETWMRDPYALYARHILGLSPLDPLNPQVGASDRGTLIHNALDQFFKICPDPHHKHASDILLTIGKTLFEPFEKDPSVKLFWWPRFCHLAHWFIDYERSTRLSGTQTFTEVKGKLTLETPLGPFECTAKADRIDLLPDGRLRILDYKTGSPPSDQDVHLGFSPQLPLEGAIALQQGFEGIAGYHIESLQFWWLKGDARGGIIKKLPGDPYELSMKALAGLERMILLFEDEKIPYPARPIPGKGLKYNDYAHLARLQEWGKM